MRECYPFICYVDCLDLNHKTIKEYLTGFALDFTEATSIIEEYYGEDLVSINHLEFVGDSNILPVTEVIYEKMREL